MAFADVAFVHRAEQAIEARAHGGGAGGLLDGVALRAAMVLGCGLVPWARVSSPLVRARAANRTRTCSRIRQVGLDPAELVDALPVQGARQSLAFALDGPVSAQFACGGFARRQQRAAHLLHGLGRESAQRARQ